MQTNKGKSLYSWLLINSSILFIALVVLLISTIMAFKDSFLAMSPFIVGSLAIIMGIIASTVYLSKKYSKSGKIYQYTKATDDDQWIELKINSLKKRNKIVFHMINIYNLWSCLIIVLVLSGVIHNDLDSWKGTTFTIIYILITIIVYHSLYFTNQKLYMAWK